MKQSEKQDFRHVSPKAQDELRKKAVKFYLSGKTQKETAEVFEITTKSLRKWVRKYRQGGMRRLNARRRGRRPGGGGLRPWEQAQIVKTLKHHTPDQLGLPYVLWSREAVQTLIERRYSKKLSIWTVGRYLRKWGFTAKRTVRRAYEQKPQEVQQWIAEQYPQLKWQAKAEGAVIYWADQMGIRSDATHGLSYSKRGERAVIRGTGQRFRCTMVSAITHTGLLLFMVITVRFTGKVFIDFLRRLTRQSEAKLYLIVDQHPVHRSKMVRRWVEVHSDRIRLIFLPGYSPELNPDEYLNQDVKANAAGRLRPRNVGDLLRNVRSYLHRRQRQPQIVKHYFLAKPVRYAAGGIIS
jgi:transposase